ncbi:FeoB-associated Cys-rich membrane protein [Blastopirellula retiformator]|uniref:Virus attachment protein p12 family protein n=1 Tax=Blastopirellula retiformator TaxID=2527970 RepID=A0A5C5V4P0_9BACT|nr:FeoB-associated Cys-rich membrane protein [Blastopirellula retiformator]TWT32939.1 Virus attachment protein p12 family protein [Blastopirellula retiformator]
MSDVFQNVGVLLLIAGSATYLAISIWRTVRSEKAGCGGGCKGCGSKQHGPHIGTTLIQLDTKIVEPKR